MLAMCCCSEDLKNQMVEVAQGYAMEEPRGKLHRQVQRRSSPALQDNTVRVQGCPASLTFEASLLKRPEQKVGMRVDTVDGKTLRVILLKADGVVAEYNKQVPMERRIYAGDYIVEVNGKSAMSEMLQELSYSESMALKVAPKDEFLVLLRRSGGLNVDLRFDAYNGCLLIQEIREGAIMEYNESVASGGGGKEILPGDRIISVNGVSGESADLLEAVQQDGELTLLISRPLL